METRKIIIDYIKGLFQNWYVRIIALLDFAGLILLLNTEMEIPIWIIGVVFIVVFIYANYLLYRDSQKEIIALKESFNQKIKELGARIAELEDRYPHLNLHYQEDDRYTDYQVVTVDNLPALSDIDELVKKEKSHLKNLYSKTEEKESDAEESSIDFNSRIAKLVSLYQGRRKSREEFEKETSIYLENYKNYLSSDQDHKRYLARYRKVGFALENGGKVPATEIVLYLRFPDPFQFLSFEEKIRLVTRPPSPPGRPRTHESILEGMNRLSLLSNVASPWAIPNLGESKERPRVRGPFIKPGKSTEVGFEVSPHSIVEGGSNIRIEP
jgi:hypothetical protein